VLPAEASKGCVSVLTSWEGTASVAKRGWWTCALCSPRKCLQEMESLPLQLTSLGVEFRINHQAIFWVPNFRQVMASACVQMFAPSLPSSFTPFGPKSHYIRKQGNVAAFHVSVTLGCCPASPLTVTHPAAFTPAACLLTSLCQVRPCLCNLLALAQKYSFGSPEAFPALPSKIKQLSC